MKRLAIFAIALVLAPAILTGCGYSGVPLRVHNVSGQAWYFAVVPEAGFRFVDRIEPGATGRSYIWNGKASQQVEVLDVGCNKVGTLYTSDGTNYVVDAEPGLTATLERPGFFSVGVRDGEPGISMSHNCQAQYYA